MALLESPEALAARAERIVRELAAAVAARRLYARDHERVVESTRALGGALTSYLEAAPGVACRFRLAVAAGMLVHEGARVPEADARSGLAKLFQQRGCGGIVISPGFTREDLDALLAWLGSRERTAPPVGLAGIELLPKGAGHEGGEFLEAASELVERIPEFQRIFSIHRSAEKALEKLYRDARGGRAPDFAELDDVIHWTIEAFCADPARFLAPTQARRHDGSVVRRPVNVFFLVTAALQPILADRAGLASLAVAALVHDIGKARVPEELLARIGGLTEEERALVRRHTEFGAEILHAAPEPRLEAAHVALCHHARDDGSGYPALASGLAPGPLANLVQVADLFEGLVATRPYSERRLGVAEAMDAILAIPGMGGFRPDAAALLLQRLTPAPAGAQVVLDDGARAVVIRASAAGRPHVKVIADREGAPLPAPYDLNLEQDGDRSIREVILKPVDPLPLAAGVELDL
jgi:hypothetical protein